METFFHLHKKYSWSEVKESIYAKTSAEVRAALAKNNLTIEDFKALVSPAAMPYLDQMAMLSRERTRRRFGKTIQLYIPLYLSNKCINACVYCGFNRKNSFSRTTLSVDQAVAEARAISEMGFRHVLLVTGEHPECGLSYLKKIIEAIKPFFAQIAIEVAPMETLDYKALIEVGLNSVYVYQETYNRESYSGFHPFGKKSDFRYRLETPDRLGRADIYRIGLGCLLGLDDWRVDSWFTALHILYLSRKYWTTRYSVSLPRLRPAAGAYQPLHPVTDKELLQLICAYRLVFEDLEISLSTREDARLRDILLPYGITAMSAGSKTQPGGYAHYTGELVQFEVGDTRPPHEVAKAIKKAGFNAVWKDWDKFF